MLTHQRGCYSIMGTLSIWFIMVLSLVTCFRYIGVTHKRGHYSVISSRVCNFLWSILVLSFITWFRWATFACSWAALIHVWAASDHAWFSIGTALDHAWFCIGTALDHTRFCTWAALYHTWFCIGIALYHAGPAIQNWTLKVVIWTGPEYKVCSSWNFTGFYYI